MSRRKNGPLLATALLVDDRSSRELAEYRQAINEHYGADIETEVHDVAVYQTFDLAAFKRQLASSGSYTCQGNALWPGLGFVAEHQQTIFCIE